MSLLENIFNTYRDKWYYGFTGNHKEKSFLRFFELHKSGSRSYIKVFSYYSKTKKIDYFKISTLNHFDYIDEISNMDEDTSIFLEALYTKELLYKKA